MSKDNLIIVFILMTFLNVTALLIKKSSKSKQQANVIVQPQEVTPTKPKPEPIAPVVPKIVEPTFVDVPVVSQRIKEDSVYADIINHSRNPVLDESRNTNAHETTHMITSDLRNAYSQSLGKKVNGFYVMNGKGVILDEPRLRKSDMIPFVPQSLRSYRYPTYVTGQGAWDDTPTYIFDEWVAYVNGGATSIDDVQKGRHKDSWADSVSGCLDFSIYAVSMCMAIEAKDPEYFRSNTQFKNFMRWHLKRAYDVYAVGSKMDEFKWEKQDALLQSLRTSPDAEKMRKFLKDHFNGVWLD